MTDWDHGLPLEDYDVSRKTNWRPPEAGISPEHAATVAVNMRREELARLARKSEDVGKRILADKIAQEERISIGTAGPATGKRRRPTTQQVEQQKRAHKWEQDLAAINSALERGNRELGNKILSQTQKDQIRLQLEVLEATAVRLLESGPTKPPRVHRKKKIAPKSRRQVEEDRHNARWREACWAAGLSR